MGGGNIDESLVIFSEDKDNYKARNITIINTLTKTNPTQTQQKNLNEYELLEGIYLSKDANFIDGELIYASGYEISAISKNCTEDALAKLKASALGIGFNGLAFVETDKELDFILDSTTTSGSISKGLGSSYNLSSSSSTIGSAYHNYYAKARMVLIGVKSNNPSNINLNDFKLRLDTFNNVAKITEGFDIKIKDYMKVRYGLDANCDKAIKIIIALLVMFVIIFMASQAFGKIDGLMFFFAIFSVPVLALSTGYVLITNIVNFFNKTKINESFLNEEIKSYEYLSSLLSRDVYYNLYANASNITIKKIGE